MDAALWHWRDVCNTHCWWGYTSTAILHGCCWAMPKLWQIIIQMTWAFCLISLASLCCCWRQAEEKHFRCYFVVNALSDFLWDPTVWGGYWDQRERDGGTHTFLPLPELPQHPSEQPASQAGSVTSSVDWGHPHCEWFKWFWNYRKNRETVVKMITAIFNTWVPKVRLLKTFSCI